MRSPPIRRWSAWAIVVAGFVLVAVLLGGPSHRAAATAARAGTTTAPTTAGATSVPASLTTLPAAPTTRPATPTTARSSPTTARRVSPATPVPTSPYRYPPSTRGAGTGGAPAPTAPTTTIPPTTTTTILGIGGRVPAAPVTLPLQTTGSNGHVDPVFAWLSVGGFAAALLIIAVRLALTRPGGKDRAPLA